MSRECQGKRGLIRGTVRQEDCFGKASGGTRVVSLPRWGHNLGAGISHDNPGPRAEPDTEACPHLPRYDASQVGAGQDDRRRVCRWSGRTVPELRPRLPLSTSCPVTRRPRNAKTQQMREAGRQPAVPPRKRYGMPRTGLQALLSAKVTSNNLGVQTG